MKKINVFLIISLLVLSLSFSSFAINIPDPTNDFFVNDFADVISEENEQEIMKIGADLYEQTSAQVVVVTVDSLDGYEVDEYALELGREWGVGSKENNGVVLLLSVNDREVTIQVGYGLEGCLTDAATGRILDDYAIPYLIDDDFSTGLIEAYKAVVYVVCGEYGVELNPEYEINYYDTNESSSDELGTDEPTVLFVALFIVGLVVLVVVLFDKFLGNGPGSGGTYHGDDTTYHRPISYGGFSSG